MLTTLLCATVLAGTAPVASAPNEVLCTYSHKIASGAKGINCSTELLEQILAEAQRLGVAVVGYDELP